MMVTAWHQNIGIDVAPSHGDAAGCGEDRMMPIVPADSALALTAAITAVMPAGITGSGVRLNPSAVCRDRGLW